MKIVRAIARLNVGGPARHVVWLTESLSDEEFESTLITGRVPEGEEDMAYFAREHGVKPVFVEEMSRELSPKDLFSLWKVYSHIRKEKPDVIHTHTAKAGTIGRTAGFFYRWLTPKTLIGKPRQVKIFHTFHGHVFHSYYGNLKTKIFLFIERALAALATDKIVVISEQQKREINQKFGIGKSEQFEIVRLGIDLHKFEGSELNRKAFRDEVGVSDETILVGLVGRLTEVKNHDLFLRAAKLYKDSKGAETPEVKFVVIGNGNLREGLEKKVEETGIGVSVIFTGNRNDPEVFYAGLDIIALTSFNEGTPLSIIEGMANAKPVISTKVGGVVDLLGRENEVNGNGFTVCERGILVESDDEEGFYRGLLYLTENKKAASGAAKRGKNFVLQNYSVERLVKDIKDLYRKTCKL